MGKLTKAQAQFLSELAVENPEPSEPWFARDDWEPMFPLAMIDAMQRRKLIEVRGRRPCVEYRFTDLGRSLLASESKSP